MGAGDVSDLLDLAMLQRGVASESRLMFCTSTAMKSEDVDTAIDALDDAFAELRPGIERERPGLLLGWRPHGDPMLPTQSVISRRFIPHS